MGLFKRKKDEVLDLTEYYNKRKIEMVESNNESLISDSEMISKTSTQNENSGGGLFGIFGSTNNSNISEPPTTSTENSSLSLEAREKKRRLAKRLQDMTDKLEDISNQIYHLQQRIELLEKKAEIR